MEIKIKNNSIKFVRFPIDDGIEFDNSFSWSNLWLLLTMKLKLKIKNNSVKFVRFPIDDGIELDNWLLSMHLWLFLKMV